MQEISAEEIDNDSQRASFQQSVRTALLHLYDNAFLQNHPLTALWSGGQPGDRLTHAQELRRVLLDSIERLRPQSAAHGDAARAYAVLTYRCVDGLTIEEIEQKLGLSRRQTYREFTKGVEAVANQLQDLLAMRTPSAHTNAPDEIKEELSRRELAEAELARLGREARCEALLLVDVVAGVCKLLEPRLRRRNITIQTIALQQIAPVLADRTLLRQALLNLLSYAVDALPDGATLEITAQETPISARLLVHQVNAEPTEGRQLSPPPHREGVALTVAQSLVAAQNGNLSFALSPDGWSAEIVLPVALTPTILVIDDNRSLIELFQRYLAGHRVAVAGANSGEEATALLRQVNPQAIVLDVMMPHQDGWEVLQRLRQDAALTKTPIIVCSVLREHDLALSLGASDTLVKPVSQSALLDALRRWLGPLHPLD
ncbi:MAG: response regulator [Caldilinea sp.]